MDRRVFLRWAPAILLTFLVATMLWKGGKDLEMTWLVTAVACFLTAASIACRRAVLPRMPLDVWCCLIAFLAWSVASFFLSQTRNYGLDEILKDASFILIFLWIVREIRADSIEQFARRFVSVVSITLLVACGIGTVVYVLQPVNRFVGTFFDWRFNTDYWPNAWASEVVLLWPVLVLWATEAKTQRSVLLRLLGLAVVIGCLLLSYSRGGLLAFGGQLVLLSCAMAWWNRAKLSTLSLRRIACAVGVLALIAFTVFAGVNAIRSQFNAVQSVEEKVTFTAAEGTSSVSERSQFWHQAITLTKERPLFGWGPYSFRFVQPHLEQGILATADHPHNVFLKLAMERGIPAAALFLLFLILIAVRVIHSLRHSHDSQKLRTLLFSIGVLGLLAHSLIDFNLQFVAVSLPLWIILALLLHAGSTKTTEASGSSRDMLQKTMQLAECFVAFVLLIVVIRETPLLIESSLGRRAELAQNWTVALQWYDRAEKQWLSRDLELGRASALLSLNRPDDARAALQLLQTQNTVDGRIQKVLGLIELQTNHPQAALDDLTQAFAWDGQNDLGILSSVLLTLPHLPAADTAAWKDRTITTLQAYEAAIANNTHFIALSRNVEEFQTASTSAERLYPDLAPQIELLTASVDRHAKEERSKLTARPTGILW